jgi:hypothetical protein
VNDGIKFPVAGAGSPKVEAPQGRDDQVPRLSCQERKRKRKKPEEVPLLIENYKDFMEEIRPEEGASIRFFYRKDHRDLNALVVAFDWNGIERTFSVVEYYDVLIGDLALEVRLDGKLVAIFPEGETPWFFDADYLARMIEEDRLQTFADILGYFVWLLESLKRDLVGAW